MNQESISGADDLYSKIGQLTFDAIPDEFRVARVRVEMADDVSSCSIFYHKPDDRFQYLNDGLESVEEKFRELRDFFKSVGHEA
jgi:hypothetical protein